MTVRRYAVLDPLPTDPRTRLLKGLRAHAFLPIDPRSELDRSVGWVSMLDGEDADLQPEKVFFVATGGEQVRVALRIDTLKPPPEEVKRQAHARVAELEAAEGRKLGRRERRTVADEVKRTLRLRAFPRRKLVDVTWNLATGRLWFWSQSKADNEVFADLFAKSFGLRVDVEGAPRCAARVLDQDALAALEAALGRMESAKAEALADSTPVMNEARARMDAARARYEALVVDLEARASVRAEMRLEIESLRRALAALEQQLVEGEAKDRAQIVGPVAAAFNEFDRAGRELAGIDEERSRIAAWHDKRQRPVRVRLDRLRRRLGIKATLTVVATEGSS